MKACAILAILAAAVLVALPAADGVAQRTKAPAQRDWTETVVRTPEGGFRMGNPDAPVKVIEYLSFACVHCAQFHAESAGRLFQNHVRPGRVSIEYRNILINAPDIVATVLARCASPRGYFAMGHELLRTRDQWLGRAGALTEAQRAQLSTLDPPAMTQRFAPMLGLDRVAVRHGLTPAAQRACLSNRANFDQIERMQNEANSRFGITGTPTFVINGRVVNDTNIWSGIEPLLRG